MTVILGIDTATTGCAAALIRDAETLAERRERMARGQSEALMPMIEDVVGRAGVPFDGIDAVAVTRGPGAFTGLRIGLSAARALALALGKPCLGIGTFDALLEAAREGGVLTGADAVAVCVDSKREELFVAIFDADGHPVCEPAALRPGAVAARLPESGRIVVVGDGAAAVAPALQPHFQVKLAEGIELPGPAVVARLGLAALEAPENAPAVPLYLRPPDVTMPKG